MKQTALLLLIVNGLLRGAEDNVIPQKQVVALRQKVERSIPQRLKSYPLHRAAALNQAEEITSLLNLGEYDINCFAEDVNAQKIYNPLIIAAKAGALKSVGRLLEHGASLNERNSRGHSAIFFAARYGRLETLKYLCEKGASLKNKGEISPLDCTIKHRSSHKCMPYLILKGVRPGIKPLKENGYVPFMHMMSAFNSLQRLTQVASRADMERLVRTRDNEYDCNYPLAYAVAQAKLDNIKILLAFNAPLCHVNSQGKNVFDIVADIQRREDLTVHERMLYREVEQFLNQELMKNRMRNAVTQGDIESVRDLIAQDSSLRSITYYDGETLIGRAQRLPKKIKFNAAILMDYQQIEKILEGLDNKANEPVPSSSWYNSFTHLFKKS